MNYKVVHGEQPQTLMYRFRHGTLRGSGVPGSRAVRASLLFSTAQENDLIPYERQREQNIKGDSMEGG